MGCRYKYWNKLNAIMDGIMYVSILLLTVLCSFSLVLFWIGQLNPLTESTKSAGRR